MDKRKSSVSVGDTVEVRRVMRTHDGTVIPSWHPATVVLPPSVLNSITVAYSDGTRTVVHRTHWRPSSHV